jgi:hypothetical protein
MNSWLKKLGTFFYDKLFKINDTPQRIAAGFGLGVFSGIIPGTGPLAALFLAIIFRVNRASAILASLITNFWLSLVTFIFSIKVGSAILRLDWQKVYHDFNASFTEFDWQAIFKSSLLKIIFPVVLGYFVISIFLGVFSYLLILLILKFIKH